MPNPLASRICGLRDPLRTLPHALACRRTPRGRVRGAARAEGWALRRGFPESAAYAPPVPPAAPSAAREG